MDRHGTVLSVVLVAIASAVGLSQDTTGWKTCIDNEDGVSFRYPNHWLHSGRYSAVEFEGSDGSVQIDASGGTSLNPICDGAATHKLLPYGKHPRIQFLKVQNHPACIVWPSADQGAPHLAQLIVEYPQPITINGDQYRYLTMYADKEHIRAIIGTLQFIPPTNK